MRSRPGPIKISVFHLHCKNGFSNGRCLTGGTCCPAERQTNVLNNLNLSFQSRWIPLGLLVYPVTTAAPGPLHAGSDWIAVWHRSHHQR